MSVECVTPGRRLGLADEYDAGAGTYVRNGMIYASILGTKTTTSESSPKPTVQVTRSAKFAIPTIGSHVLARVLRINPRAASVSIMMVDSTPCKDFLGTVRVQDIRATEKDSVRVHLSFRPGDVIRAEVISLGDQRSYYLSTAKDEFGVVFAQSVDGNAMVPVSWEDMQDTKTQIVSGLRKPISWLPFHTPCNKVLDYVSQTTRLILVRILRQGHIPAHISFIMDGNRRYARTRHRLATSGHLSGFHNLTRVLDWCNALGIAHVSVFAFAINNFSRSQDEVEALMDLAKNKLRELATKSELVKQHNVRICVVGNRELLNEEVQKAAEFAEDETKNNTGMQLNICFPYSATDEISYAVQKVAEDVASEKLQIDEIDERVVADRLRIKSPDPDILVRTSGQVRFSNYMLWQSAKRTHIQFIDVFWPDFSFFNMFTILISWQLAHDHIRCRSQT
ncbi:cis-prenyltransferase [Coemansia sp. RSA 1972]|nr:cis-prenyltransferase [Coemansia sp. RSA 1972]